MAHPRTFIRLADAEEGFRYVDVDKIQAVYDPSAYGSVHTVVQVGGAVFECRETPAQILAALDAHTVEADQE
ncbi:hypothetical protein [Nocardia otitidiscaviarum]|uniref:hypothetical protein n=1 Tax=Nocardia otitidiscaviarum TaxID=1823 RepID=UPI0004A6F9BF|nr:hypothetical protein [Nocardia otitidiscaviarum]